MHAPHSSVARLNTQRLYFIAQATKLPNHSRRVASLRFLAYRGASFLVTDSLVQNDPNQSTKPMRNCSDCLPVSQARYQPAVHELEDASFVLDRGISRLIEDPSHVTVTRGAAVLLFIPALSSSPGHAPTHEDRFLGEAKVAAVAPTSAMICCAESGPRPGTSDSRCT